MRRTASFSSKLCASLQNFHAGYMHAPSSLLLLVHQLFQHEASLLPLIMVLVPVGPLGGADLGCQLATANLPTRVLQVVPQMAPKLIDDLGSTFRMHKCKSSSLCPCSAHAATHVDCNKELRLLGLLVPQMSL